MQPEPGANGTDVTEFVLLGLVETPELRPVVSVLFLFAYVVTVGGNLSILEAILVEPKLHTPTYFFLGNLSVLDIGCITLVGVDCFWLTAMAYDQFLAICQPLTYSIRMSQTVQRILVAVSWACAFTNALTHTVAISTLNFCGPSVINHFYCDLPQLFQLSCSSTQLQLNELLLFGGRKKAFSKCGSHLTVVCLFYGSGIFNYMRLGSAKLSDKDKVVEIFNTVINPMLNPIIYSLWNPDVRGALRQVLMGRWSLAR
ncbi:Olfactory receptor 3A1 [Camelus dromedarius]|uniref:Olfactory receptor 3A1 n=1 Tax=Camelus dromedarius TaxID=9838 RepID=A0A5N4D297_CAMDR|nr:Olfactory receptor 3A1 [Camelus dromedarius]